MTYAMPLQSPFQPATLPAPAPMSVLNGLSALWETVVPLKAIQRKTSPLDDLCGVFDTLALPYERTMSETGLEKIEWGPWMDSSVVYARSAKKDYVLVRYEDGNRVSQEMVSPKDLLSEVLDLR